MLSPAFITRVRYQFDTFLAKGGSNIFISLFIVACLRIFQQTGSVKQSLYRGIQLTVRRPFRPTPSYEGYVPTLSDANLTNSLLGSPFDGIPLYGVT